MSCCGINDYQDFDSSQNWLENRGTNIVPDACCILADKSLMIPKDANCTRNPTDANSYYKSVSFKRINPHFILFVADYNYTVCFFSFSIKGLL